MPKDKKFVEELQKQRIRQKAQVSKYIPAKIELQVVGNGGHGEPRAILIVTDHINYLFNCGEGTQRLAHEHRVRLTKVEHAFITRPVWDNMGGILGLALTVQDSGVPIINLHGPDGTKDMFEVTKNFVNLETLKVVKADTSKKFTDHTMEVNYITLINTKEFKTLNDDQTKEIFDDTKNNYGKRLRSSSTNIAIPKSCHLRINSIMAFACKIHPKPGTLDRAKCEQLGVPFGPCLGQLKAGKDITLPDGRVIKSSDVVSPSDDGGPLIIVLECPDEEWLEIIENCNDFDQYQKPEIFEKFDIYIVHFSPKDIVHNPRYKKWMEKFGTQAQHLILNEENVSFSSEAIHKMQNQLHIIHPDIFPLLEEQNLISNFFNLKEEINKQGNELKTHQCKTLNTINLRPHSGLNADLSVSITPEEYVKDVFEIEGFSDRLSELKTDLKKKIVAVEEYPKLLMLGTGSSIPNKVRNTSGMLLQITKEESIILDCGEGTVGQLIRFFGSSKVEEILKNIKAVYVSHLHADHHLGFIGILKKRANFTSEPLVLLAPQQISEWLEYYDKRFESISHCYSLISNESLLSGNTEMPSAAIQCLYENLNVKNISTTFVEHCRNAFGVAITLENKKIIAYSGDTVTNDDSKYQLKNLGKCDYLIHEATMEDGLEEEAKIKKHSTISEAIKTGKDMGAEFTLLTHFSQRYSKLPFLPDENSGVDFTKVGIAFDFMHISLAQFNLLPSFYPSLKVMFNEFIALLDQKAKMRDIKKERELKDNSIVN